MVIGKVDFEKLHPKVRRDFQIMAIRLTEGYQNGVVAYHFKPFEGFRSPEKQTELVLLKRSKAGPWQSAHNYGLAVDFVPWDEKGGFFWPDAKHPAWDYMRDLARNRGLINQIDWDRPHVEHPIWWAVKRHLI